jgi:predicted PurR-regulated permease PerM
MVILFAAMYFAFDPELYRRGVVRLVPPPGRQRAEDMLDSLKRTLRGWLISQSFSMTVVGLMTTTGLWLLGIPLSFVLGFIEFTFTFVPYVGPMVAAVPAILVAITVGQEKALYVAFLCFAIQMIEGESAYAPRPAASRWSNCRQA